MRSVDENPNLGGSHSAPSRVGQALATLSVGAVLLAASPLQASEDRTIARSLAATCANCHGTDGRAQSGMTVLAGYPADRLVLALQEFRSGKRPATIMHQIAKGYTDAQIASIAGYFAARKPN